jgi:hypothetical protein
MKRTSRWLTGGGVVAVLMLLVGGCAIFQKKTENPALPAPDIRVQAIHYSGSPLSGPTTRAVELLPNDRLDVRTEILALRTLPNDLPVTLGSAARLISASRSGTPVQPTNKLTLLSRFAVDALAQDSFAKLVDPQNVKSVSIFTGEDAVLPEVTSKLSLQLAADRSIDLSLYRAAGTSAVVIALTIAEPVRDSEQSAASITRETAVLDAIDTAQPRDVLLVIPQEIPQSPAKGLAILLKIKPADANSDSAALMEHISQDLKQSSELAGRWPQTATVGSAQTSEYQSSLDALKDPIRRRAALVYLAGQTGAPICEDVALVAEDAALEKLASQITQNAKPETTSQRELLGWILDLSTFQLLAQLQADTKTKIAPELMAVLTRHTGEAGRHDSSMEQIVKNLSSKADLANRLVAENLIYLEDSSPAARVRAYDFLNSRGRAPAGYDPLGTPRDRRNALEKASIK